MNNEMTMTIGEERVNQVMNQTAQTLNGALCALTRYYNKVLERRISNRQTLHLLNAQLAFIMTVMPADCSLLLRAFCGAWLVKALMKCKEVMAA